MVTVLAADFRRRQTTAAHVIGRAERSGADAVGGDGVVGVLVCARERVWRAMVREASGQRAATSECEGTDDDRV